MKRNETLFISIKKGISLINHSLKKKFRCLFLKTKKTKGVEKKTAGINLFCPCSKTSKLISSPECRPIKAGKLRQVGKRKRELLLKRSRKK